MNHPATAEAPAAATDCMPGRADQRSTRRIDAEVELTYESEHNFFTGFSENISEGGLFLATYAERRIGETLTLRFTLPGIERPIETTAEVRWARNYNPASDTPPGVGLRFVSLSDEDRALIERFVHQRDPIFYDE